MNNKLNYLIGLSVAVLFACGCKTSALVGRSGPSAKGQKSLACFAIKVDFSAVKGIYRPTNGEGIIALVVINDATQKETYELLYSTAGAPGAPSRTSLDGSTTTQLIMLELPAGEYSLRKCSFANSSMLSGWNELDTKKKMSFTVKESQVTYAGEATVRLETLHRGLTSETITWTIDSADTASRDETWAKRSFPWLKNMPSAVVLFCTKLPTPPASGK